MSEEKAMEMWWWKRRQTEIIARYPLALAVVEAAQALIAEMPDDDEYDTRKPLSDALDAWEAQ